MSLLTSVLVACAVMAFGGKSVSLVFAHSHSPGRHCGWSGCQAQEVIR